MYSRIDTLQQYVVTYAQNRIELERNKLQRLAEKVPIVFSVVKTSKKDIYNNCYNDLQLECNLPSVINKEQ